MVKLWLFLYLMIFSIVSSLNHIYLPLFMIHKVNVILFRQFLGFYCLSKLIIWLNHDVFLISLLFRIVSSLNHIYLPLFMIHKVNVILFRQFLGFYCLSKLIIWLNHDVFLICDRLSENQDKCEFLRIGVSICTRISASFATDWYQYRGYSDLHVYFTSDWKRFIVKSDNRETLSWNSYSLHHKISVLRPYTELALDNHMTPFWTKMAENKECLVFYEDFSKLVDCYEHNKH